MERSGKLTDTEYAEALTWSIEGDPSTRSVAGPSRSTCAKYEREVDDQYRFMMFYQVLVAVLAGVALLLLIWAAFTLARSGATFNALVTGAGGLVTGSGAGFLKSQRGDATRRYHIALKRLEDAGCA